MNILFFLGAIALTTILTTTSFTTTPLSAAPLSTTESEIPHHSHSAAAIALTPISTPSANVTGASVTGTVIYREPIALLEAIVQVQPNQAVDPLPQSDSIATQNTVTGTVFYSQRSALPPNSVVLVELQDVSRQDAAAIVLGNQIISPNGGQVPFEFEILYDPALIQEGNTYVIRALITADGQPQFASASRYAVITNGHPNQVEVQVEPVR